MTSIDTVETNKFIDITSDAPLHFPDEFGEFEESLVNENNMPHDTPSASDLYSYILSQIERCN